MILIIDPGHSGLVEPGASGHGIIEATYVWQVAVALGGTLLQRRPDVDWYMTRGETPTGKVTLRQRGAVAARHKADLVLSLHCNASLSEEASGLMAFYWPENLTGMRVAKAIQRAAPAIIGSRIEAGPYPAREETYPRVRNVLQVYRATAVLVELGFLTHAVDAAALRDSSVQTEISRALLAGVEAFQPFGDY